MTQSGLRSRPSDPTFRSEKVSGLRVQDFRTKHGSDILKSIAAQHDVCKATLQHVKFMLSGVFVLAKNEGLYDGLNPMQDVMLPEAKGSRETGAYTLDEILAMLRLPFDARTKAVIGVAGFAGLRESEISGLQWSDYDGTDITVLRSIDRVTRKANPPKTAKSAASIPVIAPLKRLLEAHKANAALGTDGQPMPDAPVFPGIRQKYADLDKLALLVIRPVLESSGLRWLGWHGFRRATASNLYALGADDLTVQRVLRHAKVTVTREHYIKIRDEKVDTAMLKYEDEIERKFASGAVEAQ